MSRSSSRLSRRAIAGLAVGLMTVGVLVVGVAGPASAAPDVAHAASEKAQVTGVPVPIPELTDSFSTVTAQPDGTFQKNLSDVPERISRDGGWANVDATLHANPDGSLSPAASYAPLTLSGGGSGPLAVLHQDQASLSLTWTSSLPAPTVAGPTATYPNVLPGVDLQVTADTLGGMSDVLVVKTAEAADNPALATLTLGTQTSTGLTVQSDAGNNVDVLDTNGQALFHSPGPMMWDSTTTTTSGTTSSTAAAPVSGPGPGAQVKPVSVQADNDSVTLTPDAGLLTGSATQYPVYIDPAWTGGQTYYAWVQQAYPDSSNWNTTDNGEPAVGYCGWADCGTYGITRAFYQFHPGSLTDTHVLSAYFKISGVSPESGSANCDDAHPMVVNSTAMIDHTIHWGNEPALWSQQDTANAYNGYGSCPDRTTSFNVTTSAQADSGQGSLTYRVRANDESNKNDYMRFNHAASLTINYNKIPNTPTSFAFSPAPRNPASSTYTDTGWIGATSNISLAAHISDPDGSAQNINGEFHLWDKGGNGTADPTDIIAWTNSSGHTSKISGTGGTVNITVPTTTLTDGHKYGTDALTTDSIDNSPVTDYHYFWYDATAPNGLAIDSADFPETGKGTSSLHVGQTGTFTLAATDPTPSTGKSSGLDHFSYSTASATDIGGDGGTHVTAASDGTAQFTLTPTLWGVNYVYVAAVDKAGNQSATVTYRYYVPDDATATVHPGDVDGDGHPDLLATNTDGTLQLYQTTPDGPEVPVTASTGANSPNGTSWANVLIAHRSSINQSDSANKVDDLWAHQQDSTDLYLYTNNLNNDGGLAGNNNQYYTSPNYYPVGRPNHCADNDCTGYDTNSWTNISQLIAPGDMDGDGIPDLLTVENDTLWLFPGIGVTGAVGAPHRLGDDFAGMRLVAPGDSTGDGIPDLWGFNDQQAFNLYASRSDNGTVTLTTTAGTDTAYSTAARPLITSPGDVDGDGSPDLYTTCVTGNGYQLWANMGTTLGPDHPKLSPHVIVDDTLSWENITHLS